MFARRAAAEVGAGHQDRRAAILRLVQHERGLELPVVKEEGPEAGSLNPFQKLLRDDLIGIDVITAQGYGQSAMDGKWLARHDRNSQ
jgi:hypothetical protein